MKPSAEDWHAAFAVLGYTVIRTVFFGLVISASVIVLLIHGPALKELKDRIEWDHQAHLARIHQLEAELLKVQLRLPPQKGIGAKGEAAGAVEEN